MADALLLVDQRLCKENAMVCGDCRTAERLPHEFGPKREPLVKRLAVAVERGGRDHLEVELLGSQCQALHP